LNQIEVAERRGPDGYANPKLKRVDRERAQPRLAVVKIEPAFPRQIGQAVPGEYRRQMLARVIQVPGAEDQFARQTAWIVYPARFVSVRLRSLGHVHGQPPNRVARAKGAAIPQL
jgi:hypothetical protein